MGRARRYVNVSLKNFWTEIRAYCEVGRLSNWRHLVNLATETVPSAPGDSKNVPLQKLIAKHDPMRER